MKHNMYCKTHCAHLCIFGHTPSHELELKKIDDNPVTNFPSVCPNTNLTCWEKFHTCYGPICLFTNPSRITDTYAGCFIFGHQKLYCDLFLQRKAAFGKRDIIRDEKKRNRGEDDGDNGGDDGINIWDNNGNIKEEYDNNSGDDSGEYSIELDPSLRLFGKHDTGPCGPTSVIAICVC
jgi:hypothetical protein